MIRKPIDEQAILMMLAIMGSLVVIIALTGVFVLITWAVMAVAG